MKTHECPDTQECRVCGQLLPKDVFSFIKRDNRHATICKPCNAKRSRERYANPEKRELILEKQRQYGKSEKGKACCRRKYERHGHKLRAQLRARYASDPEYRERQKAQKKRWHASEAGKAFRKRNYLKHAEMFKAHATKRYRLRRSATPIWFEPDKVIALYKEAEKVSQETGIKHEVDHIVPLRGKNVSGLHWHGNLQILPMKDNRSKGNKFSG